MDDVNPIERLASNWTVTGAMVMWENSHYQYLLGYLPEEHWNRIRADIKKGLDDPLWGQTLQMRKYFMRASFRAVVEDIERELAAEAVN